MNPRLMRLTSDYERMKAEFLGHDTVIVEPIGTTMPPEKYRITFRIPGLRMCNGNKQPQVVDEHVAEIYLHQGYPREKPKCTMLSAIWHPNFAGEICIGDYWAAGETLVDVIVQIGDMIQYKVVNTRSPLNAEAAKWAEKHRRDFPIGNVPILRPELEVQLGPRELKALPDQPKKTEINIELGHARSNDVEIELR